MVMQIKHLVLSLLVRPIRTVIFRVIINGIGLKDNGGTIPFFRLLTTIFFLVSSDGYSSGDVIGFFISLPLNNRRPGNNVFFCIPCWICRILHLL